MRKNLNKFLAGAAVATLSSTAFGFGGAPASAEIDNTGIANHQQTWEFKALTQQNRLDNATPMAQGFNVMGHNAYNSSAYSSIVHLDPNHSLSIVELLDLGVRTIELDYHWVHQTKDLPAGSALLMCHAGGDDIGCSGLERYLHEGVEEVNRWLRKNPKEVVVLYFQDDAEGHDTELRNAVSSIDDLIYKQPTDQCTSFRDMVKTISEEDILNAGKQVVIMGSTCSGRGAWSGYSWGSAHNWVSGGGQGILDKSEAECLSDTDKQEGVFRIWEDMTTLGRTFGDPGPKIDASLAAKAGRCGIGALSLDMISIGDSRMMAAIWSWAENEPSGGEAQNCGFVRDNGRYYDGNCDTEASNYVCSNGPTNWKVTEASGYWTDGIDAICKAEFGSDYAFAMPTNSQQNEWLKVALNGLPHAWVNYTDKGKEDLWLTPAHNVDYGDGTIPLKSVIAGDTYNFFMRATANNCELQWNGGSKDSGERNAKVDCLGKGDPMMFVADESPVTAADGSVSVHGIIKTIAAGGETCGLQWDSSLESGERNAKFDCSGSADPITITSYADGSSARVRITTDNNCGLQWAGGDADSNGERNAKFDCGPAWDDFTLYGVTTSDKSAKFYRYGDAALPVINNWGSLLESPDALLNWNNGKTYAFVGNQYYRIDNASGLVDQGPTAISGNWGDLPWTSIDAAVKYNDTYVYIFKGASYVWMNMNTKEVSSIRNISSGWDGMDGAFAQDLDGAVNWGNGKIYLFKGHQYVRYDISDSSVDSGYPAAISGNWDVVTGPIKSVSKGILSNTYLFK